MDEKILYTGLLKGAIIGNIKFADSLAARLADLIEKSNALDRNIARFTADLIYYYGDMLEEDEEEALRLAANLEGNPELPGILRALEAKYGHYFLEMLSGRREKVETIYNDVTAHSNLLMDDDEIKEIKKCESLGAAEEAGVVFKKILRLEKNATLELHKKTIQYVISNVIKNSGEKDDASEVWSLAQSEFRRKLDKLPSDPSYYQWRPGGSVFFEKTSIFTFFIRICNFRWLDILRKRARENEHQKALYEQLKLKLHDQADSEAGDENDLRSIVRDALDELANPCRELIRGKWFGGDYGDGLTSKELSSRIGMAAGTIDNLHKGCLKRLGLIVNQKMA